MEKTPLARWKYSLSLFIVMIIIGIIMVCALWVGLNISKMSGKELLIFFVLGILLIIAMSFTLQFLDKNKIEISLTDYESIKMMKKEYSEVASLLKNNKNDWVSYALFEEVKALYESLVKKDTLK